ncbi:MAG: peptidase S8/S53 subtilisin kexin sedolisin [archaeon GW2011_AR3]|nr:MAG: peptidase S8/S53 subtilisin kexin sedolisin [archaeon GW2011_AR3]
MSSRKPIRKEKITNPGEHLEEWKKFKEQLKEHYESNPDQKIQDKDLHYWKEHADNRIASLEDEVKKAERKQKWAAGLPYAYLVVLLFVALFLGNGNLTGFVVSEQAYDSDLGGFIGYSESIGISYVDSNQYMWQPDQAGTITAVRLSGTVIGEGTARVYLADGSSKYLIYDSTGDKLALADGSAKPGWPTYAEDYNDNISAIMEYAQDSEFDTDNDGLEAENGVVDFTVENSDFGQGMADDGKCTRWEIYSEDEKESSFECYGAERCCNFIGLIPAANDWNERYYVFKGKYTATENNKVRSQLVYVSEDGWGIHSTGWMELNARFESANKITFARQCRETCDMSLASDHYFLLFELDNAAVSIDSIEYALKDDGIIAGTVVSGNQSINESYDAANASDAAEEIPEAEIVEEELEQGALDRGDVSVDGKVLEEISGNGKARVILKKKVQPSVLDFAAVLEAAIQGDTGQIKTVNFARDEFFEEMQGMEGITGFAPQDAGLLEEKIKEKKKDVADSKKAAEDVTSLLASANILKIEQETDDIIAVEIDAADLADLVASGEFSEIAVDEPVSLFIEESMALTKIADVKNTGYDGTGRKICFLDTGMNYDAFGLALNSTVFGKDFINDDDDPMDDHGHGTSVANVLLNVAPSASIYSAKVVNASGYGYESDVLAGLQYCMDQNVDVISFSIGSGMSDGFCDSNLVASLSNDAVEQGIYVASATGNDGSQTGLRVPACASKVARVAATTKQDEVAPYSNVNEIVDIFAPGSLINTIDLNGNAIVSSGTSYSAPFVAASAALLLQNESLAPAEMTYRLRSTSEVFNYSGIQRNRLSLWNALIDNVTNEPYDYSAGEANASTSVYVVQYSYVSSVVSDPILYSVADEDTGDRSWSTIATGYDPRYAAVSDNAYSRVYLGSNDVSDYLNLTHFTFTSIPSTAVVMGIEVAVERHCINTCDVFSDHTVQLLKNSVPVGDNKATGLYDWNPTTDTVVTYGSSTDLWGTSWSRSDVTNSWFGVRYAVQNGVDRQYQARVDMINITIYYNMPPTIYQQINFTNWTSAHAFNMSAAVTDVDGASDILFTNYTVNNTNVVCHPGSNSSNGNVFNVTYNCSGPALTHVKVMINFSDTAGNHIFTNYSEYIVPNLPPTITSGSVYPNTVYVGNNVTMNINTMSDPEGDGITKFWYRFYSGGLSQSNIVQDWTVLNRTNYTIQVTDAHKTIYIRAKVEDNYTNSSEYTRQVAVANSLPGHDINMSLYPLSGAYMTTTLRANCNFTDADGDSYTRYYNFYDVNDSAYRTGWTTTPTYTPSSHAANAHDNLTASCKANDGYGDSEEVYTNLTITVHMDNTAPGTPTSLSLTNPVYVGSTLTASGSGASDADSDTLSYYYDFYNVNDSTSLQSYSTDATYVLAASDAHDRIRVRVYANDTLNGGNYYEQNRTVSNSNPAMYKQNVVNHSHTSHSFIVTANVSDDDTAADIIHTSIATTSGTCTLVGNSTSGNYYGAKYNCTGTPYQSTTIRIGFKDAFDATVNSTATSHTYINHVPEVYLQNNFTNASIGHSFIVAANVSDNDTYTDIVATSIAISSGSCTLLGNSSAWRYFGVRYNCTGLGLVPASASIGFLDIAGDDINTTTSTNHYPNNAPTLLSDVTFANLSGYHGFLATANATDLDGASDIRVVAINTSNGTCDYVRNSSSLNNFGVVFNCTGKGLEIASVIVNFTDNSSEFITTSGANTYPNMAPEINPVSLNQSTFATTEEINASALAWDDDLDTLNATFYWIVNGIGRFTDTRWVIPYNTNISSVLASTGYHAFERIKVNITILDNNSYQNSTVSMEYFIYDSNAPEIGLLSQSSGYYDNITDITLSAEAQDEDGVWYAYIATNESGAWSNHTTLTNFPLGNYSDFNFTANETHITGMAYVSSKYYIIGNDTARVREINETGGFTNFNFSVAAQDTNPTGIAFINGKFYVLGNATNSVYEYNMTGNYTGFNYSVGSQDTAPLSLAYANGKMYVLGQANKRVYEYNVSGGYTGYSWNVADVETDPRGLTFVYPNFYLAGASGLSVFEFNGSGNYSGRSMNFSQHIADPQAITFGSGKFYIADSVTGLVFEYHNLSSYNSPVAVNSYPYEYSIESFIWNNHSKLNKDVVAWRIYSVDYSGNINTSAVRTFTVVTTTQGEIEMEPGSDF